jgi:hypothetical protein
LYVVRTVLAPVFVIKWLPILARLPREVKKTLIWNASKKIVVVWGRFALFSGSKKPCIQR